MTMECYYSSCPHHSCHDPREEGPFCYQKDCLATPEQMQGYEQTRINWLVSRGFPVDPWLKDKACN